MEYNNFWLILSNNRIEIPAIQRDYAQGRSDKKAETIRKEFVKELVSALEQEDKVLKLDFIYGKILGKIDVEKLAQNRKAIESLLRSVKGYADNLDIVVDYSLKGSLVEKPGQMTTFIPLDGQQRLTTLYLLHWYIARQAGEKHPLVFEKFTYKTRKTTKDFCVAMAKCTLEIAKEGSLSERIKDAPWFFSAWERDPSVRGMLRTLDVIHQALKEKPQAAFSGYWDRLTKKEWIQFQFLDLEKLELTDELYVKMNARGKHLTGFENFKAQMEEALKEELKDHSLQVKDWQKRLDVEWLDLFWAHKKPDIYEVDNEYLAFFRNMGLLFFIEKVKLEDSSIVEKDSEIIDLLRKEAFISYRFYKEENIFNKESLNRLFLVLERLESSKNYFNEVFDDTKIIDCCFGEANLKLNYWDTVYLYALFIFIFKVEKSVKDYTQQEKDSLFSWMRVCKNLIYNSRIDEQIDLIKAIHSLMKMSDYVLDIYAYLSNESNGVAYFVDRQVREEKLKSQLILADKQWEEVLVKYENHEYFYGQIGFLLEYAKTNEHEYDMQNFIIYADKASKYFTKQNLENKKHLLERALLTKGNYLIKKGINYSFCLPDMGSARKRDENWRLVFNDSDKSKILKAVLDDRDDLLSIINKSTVNDWRLHFIRESGEEHIIHYCQYREIRFINEYKIFLLKYGKISQSHTELYSHSFFKKLKILENQSSVFPFTPFKRIGYWETTRESDLPCVYIDQWIYEDVHYALDIRFLSGIQYEICFFYRGDRDKQYHMEVKNHLILLGFAYNVEDNFYYTVQCKNETETLEKIQDLCNCLQTLP